MVNHFPPIYRIIQLRHRYEMPQEIGIEIEMEGHYLALDANRKWIQKGDGSLRGAESMEYITNGPVSRAEVRIYLESLLYRLENDRNNKERPAVLQPSDRCGVHIHVNCQDLTFSEVLNYIFLYLIIEKVLVGYCGESREGNMFCLRASDAEYFVDRMIECKKYSDLQQLMGGGDELRYASINPGALFKFGSLEFRALRTPDNLLDIEEWMRLLVQVKDSAAKFEEPVNIIEHYSRMGEDRFFRDVMGPTFSTLLRERVRDVDEKILNGIRLVQDIAYVPTIKHPIGLGELNAEENRPRRRRELAADREMARRMEQHGGNRHVWAEENGAPGEAE
jgi:hypothetical protein